MTLKDKKNKREYQNKLKAQGATKDNDKTTNLKDKAKSNKTTTKPESEPAPVASHFEGVAENADKLITEANQRYMAVEAQQEEIDPKYAKRNITSNWTKYELPSSDEEDEASQSMTGADFNYVLASAQGADSHFRLKAEKEWESSSNNLGELSEEFFSLDLSELERSVSCLPLHQQICLDQEEFDKDMLERLVKKSEAARGGSIVASAEAEEVISQKILDILHIGKKNTPKELLTVELSSREAAKSEGDVEVVKSNTVEQSQTKVLVPTALGSSEFPLGQRSNRRQGGTKSNQVQHEPVLENPTVTAADEERDLKFFENIEKDNEAKVEVEDSKTSTLVVPVTILGEETKNLEDWLDDFLDE